jgi:hypothetical protein
VENEKQFTLRFHDYAFAHSSQTNHSAPFDGGQRWIH